MMDWWLDLVMVVVVLVVVVFVERERKGKRSSHGHRFPPLCQLMALYPRRVRSIQRRRY